MQILFEYLEPYRVLLAGALGGVRAREWRRVWILMYCLGFKV